MQSVSGNLNGYESWKEENVHATQAFHYMQTWNCWTVIMCVYVMFLDDR